MRVAAIALLLILSLPAVVQSQDPAYVDSPQNKAVPDPARADDVFASAGSGAATQARTRQAEEQAMAQAQAARIAETERHIREQMERFKAEQEAAASQQDPVIEGPPIGGHSMIRALEGDRADPYAATPPRAPSAAASPGRQIGSALLQDAAGVVDNRVQREIYGRNGVVIFPPTSTDR